MTTHSTTFSFHKQTNKSFSFFKKIFIALFLAILYYGCTDVPLTYSSTILDSDIIGYWQETDSTAVNIYKSRGAAYVEYLKFDRKTRRYKRSGKDQDFKLYFTKIGSGGSSRYFLSQQYSKKVADGYVNAKFIATSKSLVIFPISDDYIKKYKKIDDGLYKFGTSRLFKDFTRRHYLNTGFFDKSINYTRRKSKSALAIPKYKRPTTPSSSSKSSKNATYRIEQTRVRKYIPELSTWDDFTEWVDLDKSKNSVKFYSTGLKIIINIDGESLEIFAADLKYNETQRIDDNTIWYLYDGVAKVNNQVIGDLRLDLLGSNYTDFRSGISGKVTRADVQWNNKKVKGKNSSTRQFNFLMRY